MVNKNTFDYVRRSLPSRLLVCLTLLCGGAAAQQSGVTLYGIIDLGIEYDQVRQSRVSGQLPLNSLNQNFFGMSNGVQSGSRWGLRATESLGSGLAINVVLEGGFNPAQGTASQGGRLFGRQSTLGISHRDAGSLDFGRQINLASNYFLSIDPFGEGFGQANIGSSFGSANTTRYANMLLLQATPLAGLTLGAGYSFATQLSGIYAGGSSCLSTSSCPTQGGEDYNFVSNQNMRALTLGARYSQGALDLAVAYDMLYGDVTQPAASVSPSAWLLGGAYDFKSAKLSLALGRVLNGLINGQNSGTGAAPSGLETSTGPAGGVLFLPGAQASSYMVGLTIPVREQSNILASWQMMQPQGLLSGDAQFKAQQIYSLAMTHQFSARTNIYTYVSYAQNYAMVSSAESFVMGVGVRHKF